MASASLTVDCQLILGEMGQPKVDQMDGNVMVALRITRTNNATIDVLSCSFGSVVCRR